jgi:hypothetical protein
LPEKIAKLLWSLREPAGRGHRFPPLLINPGQHNFNNMEREQMTEEEELALAALATGVTKGETTSEEVFRRTGIPEQILDRICIAYYDYIDTLEVQLGDNAKLSRGTEAEITQAVLDAAKICSSTF